MISKVPKINNMNTFGLGLIVCSILTVCVVNADEKKTFPVGVTYGTFIPASSVVRDKFGSRWTRFSITRVDTKAPRSWKPSIGFTSLRSDGPDKAQIQAVTWGMVKGFGDQSGSVQPFVAVRGGPFLANIDAPGLGLDISRVGLNAGASAGFVFSRRFVVEARYDYFSRIGGLDLDGLTLQVGVKLLDIKI